ncbi:MULTISPECIES: protein kinase [unclassified Microcoleus]|uniref:protein kinase domain-containing protein n=1 Tax=unclassified Microcoleus TaxID=2642155 RepID=UPI001D8930EA|nr:MULTISPECIES: protein kinase [unclassified Microcoleus]MCC3505270.1 protein kinase [Microcoleus sp. PH2017_19_SFW_U_A]TAF89879.1 MAG: CHAT domain-containing protein [Oscillatoriales cyanobacterium]MCC3446056.1 protein kinase [Microcoleus sp. PH2017_09_SFU_O_A]MCC3523236.1 protein kinase [Microcoleus sp. PH2017_20_SFW_D_A]MCC3554514.1 protein kinase [Microcoleus sp. PH2017_35_SFW_U_B]
MGKIVLLDLVEGNFDRGFTVTVRIETEEEHRCIGYTTGKLPQSPDIREYYELWQSRYLSRVSPMRSATRIGGHTNPDAGIRQIEADTRKLQSSINVWLNSYEMSPIKEELLHKLTDKNEEIRFIFKTDDPKLQRLPWHSWDIFHPKYYAKASAGLFLPVGKQPPIPRKKVKVLAVFGKKEAVGNTTKIKTDKDWELLQKFLSRDSNGDIIRLDEPTCEELGEEIEKQSPQIFFFAGHSKSEDDAARGVIELNQDESITIEHLKHDITGAVEHGLQLAIFNSCDGLGIAQQLRNSGVPNVIVMREIVPDEVAQKFLQRFLEAFVAGYSVSLAVRKAREKLNRLENRFPGVTFLPVSFHNPAEAPLTWQALGGVETRRAEKSQIANQNSILWLPSAIVHPPQEQQNHPSHTIIIPSPQEEQELSPPGNNSSEQEQEPAPATNIHLSQSRQQPPSPVTHSFESQPQQQTRHKNSILRCSKGHENPAENNFCIHCRESLKQLPVSAVNSSSPQPQQSQLNALENQSVASVNSFSSQPQQPQVNLLGNQSAPLVKPGSTGVSYCINPNCRHPENLNNLTFCKDCGSMLLIDTRYRVIRPLGQGGFGITYEVRDRDDGTEKVLKVLTYTEPKGVELFQKEATILMRLKHPGLPKVELDGYFTFRPNNSGNSLHCLVMEKIEGYNLQQWLEKQNYTPIDSEQAIYWLKQLTEILNLVHNQNYFHRDIKPQNIMCRPNGNLALIDFGAVREVTETIQRTNGEVTRVSSSGYTPEEQKKGRAEPRSDFFALGRTFVYLLTAQQPRDLPEDARSGKLIWRNIATQTSQPLADLIDDLMGYFPKDRPKDTQVLLQRLATLSKQLPPSQRTPTGRIAIFTAFIAAIFMLSGLAFFTFAPKIPISDRPSHTPGHKTGDPPLRP